MKQSQQMREDKINHGEGVRRLWICSSGRESALTFCTALGSLSRLTSAATEKDSFARLHIPVAILAPEKTIKRCCRVAEFIFVQRDGHFADGRVQLEQNPFVIARKQRRFNFTLHFTALHLAETAGVPELVAEVAAQLDVLFIKQNILAERRGAHHAEAQRIRAELRDEVERVGRIAEALGHLAALLVADDAGEINILERHRIGQPELRVCLLYTSPSP